MKRRNVVTRILGGMLLVFVIVYLGLMYIPHKIISIAPSEVSSIRIGNGNTGKQITITERSDIEHIIGNLNTVAFRRDKLVMGVVGFSYDTTIFANNGEVYKELIISSPSTVRYGAFFCKATTNSIDYDYIANLFIS